MTKFQPQLINLKSFYSRKAVPLGNIRRSPCGEGDVGRLCSSVERAVDRQSKDLGSNPSAVESVFFPTERFSNSLFCHAVESLFRASARIVAVFRAELGSIIYLSIYQRLRRFFAFLHADGRQDRNHRL